MKYFKYIIPVFALIFLLSPILIHAYFGFTTPNPCQGLKPNATMLCMTLYRIQGILASIGLGLAVIMLIVGGIQYMVAGGNEDKVKTAKKLIVNAIIGFAIVISVVFILELVMGFLESSLGV